MCGIAGHFTVRGSPLPAPSVLPAMNEALRHRGPDDAGLLREGAVGLAMRRLSIIDLQGGHQPLGNDDGTVWIVFNGEIYNFRELRDRLSGRGHAFRTHSDTEAILRAYEEEGERCLERLRGMFALAIWDRRQGRLLLARDRLGKKPLHLLERNGTLYFASEIKAFGAAGLLSGASVDPIALHGYLLLGSVPGRRTIYEGVRRLPAAHRLIAGPDGVESVAPYWRIPPRDPSPPPSPEIARTLAALLDESVRLRLIADVPVGALLSGGLDSSLITALMTRHHDGPVRTFTIGFDEEGFDEAAAARAVARRLGTEHHEERVRLTATALLPRLSRAFDEPFADAAALPQLVLSELARRHVTVALSGDGGDELFGGYRRYQRLRRLLRLRAVPAPLRGLGARVLSLVPEAVGGARRVAGALDAARGTEADAFLRGSSYLAPDELARWTVPSRAAAWPRGYGDELLANWGIGGRRGLEAALAFDLSSYLVDDILVKVDRTSMACSLEVRVPLLDHRIVEAVAGLPASRHFDREGGKALLREVARAVLPEEVLRRPKHGFTVPVDRWFRGELAEIARERFEDSRAMTRDLFRPGFATRLLEEHRAGRDRHGAVLWALLVLEIWAEQSRGLTGRPATTGSDAGLPALGDAVR